MTLTGGLIHENSQISTLEQWKQAKHVKVETIFMVPIRIFSNFATFEVSSTPFFTEDVAKLIDTLDQFQSTNFKSCKINCTLTLDTKKIVQELNLQSSSVPREYSIRNSDFFIQFSLNRKSFKVYKKFHINI
ncbi:hypothetical protein CRE_19772 [Caenorhabditis remanei]|uniref:DUF38 domain-containing protein n=1 Tax=Caenorhabditis remanei TaxID=31234 RepID=E3MT93_CAERE|nr:hypothetical protein CRE_19772 [Caenorhabditis remanei]